MKKNYLILVLGFFTFLPSHSMFKVGERLLSQIGRLILRNNSQAFFETKFAALKAAITSNDVRKTERLLKEGAWVKSVTFDRNAPLHVAAENGNPKILELLLAWNAPIDLENENNETSLHIAARLNKENFVKELLRAGAKRGSRDIENRTPMHLPALYGFEGVVAALLHGGAEINVFDNKALSPLWYAASANHVAVLRLLLHAGAQIELPYAPNDDRVTHLVAEKGYEEAFFLLLRHGADIHARNKKRETPLHAAVKAEHLPIIQDLMLAGASAHAQDLAGVSPLDLAVNQFPHLVEALSYDKIKR